MTFTSAQERRGNGVHVVALAGQLDTTTHVEVSAVLSAALANSERGVVVDLSRVTVMDRAGLVALLRLRAQARSVRVEPVLAAPSPTVLDLFQDLGVAPLFRITCTCAQAVTLALLAHHANLSPEASHPQRAGKRRGTIPAPRHEM
jgi:anti-sigma B factor antagonist